MFPKYKYLLTYRYAEIICDLTVEFVKKYIDYKSRTKDQMEQAARSGKQNIIEGTSDGEISKKMEIKLLGVARASFEELLADYEDFLRQKNLLIYSKFDIKVTSFRTLAYSLSNLRNLSHLGNLLERPKLFGNPVDDANYLLTLCHLVTFLLSKQIKSAEEKFIRDGGYTENLYNKRIIFRREEDLKKLK